MGSFSSALSKLVPTIDSPAESRFSCGLGGLLVLSQQKPKPLPLAQVKVRTHIAGNCCRTVVEQLFHNPKPESNAVEIPAGKRIDPFNVQANPIEAVYQFPLPEDGAVVEMELVCGDLVVKGLCKEREEAQKEFDQARATGKRAALVTQERDDVHTVRVTNLPQGEAVTVRIVVIERLEAVDGQFIWRFPTTIPPRYMPGNPIGHEGDGSLPDTDRVQDGSRLQPPLLLSGGTRLDLEVLLEAPVHDLASSLHAVSLKLEQGGIRLAPSGNAELNKDFILSFSTGEAEQTALRAWTNGEYVMAVIEPPRVEIPQSIPRDAIFVVDISGSMYGSKLTSAKQALSSALHGLLPEDRFTLIAFDDRLEYFSKELKPVTDDNVASADRWIEALQPRGGTEMLPAVKAALEGDRPEGRLRSVLFVTDGQAWNEKELIAAIHHRRKNALFFTVGIDEAVNGALLKAMARAGNGTCELCTPSDDIEEHMLKLEARFGSPLVSNVKISGGTAGRPDPQTLFAGRPVTVMIEGSPDLVSVSGIGPNGEFKAEVKPAKIDFPLGKLWARERVQYLEERLAKAPFEEEAIRPTILEVALKHGIASKYTSFIAVEETRTVEGSVEQTLVQPSALPPAWSNPAITSTGAAPAGMAAPKMQMNSFSARGMAAPTSDVRERGISPRKAKKSKDSSVMRSKRMAPPSLGAAPGAAFGAPASMPAPPPMPAPAAKSESFGGGGGIRDMDVSMSRIDMDQEGADPFGPGSGSADPFTVSASYDSDPFAAPEKAEKECFESLAEEDDCAFSLGSVNAAPAPAPLSPAKGGKSGGNPAGSIARQQKANGSFGGDINETIAAVLLLLLLGHTRRSGSRRRVVIKAVQWLKKNADAQTLAWVLDELAKVEAKKAVQPDEKWDKYTASGQVGEMLKAHI